MASNIFAWSLTNGLSFPLDYGCGFYVLGLLMTFITSITFLLPDSINVRKPTLKEFANKEHERMEMSSIELVQMKTMESEVDRKTPVADNSKVPCPSDNVVVPPAQSAVASSQNDNGDAYPAQGVAVPMTPNGTASMTQSETASMTQSVAVPMNQSVAASQTQNENGVAPQE